VSARSSTFSSEGVAPGYPVRLLLGALGWTLGALGLVWLVDPYGIAPIRLSLPDFNEVKLARLDIYRQLKPIEVWLKQPRTVFLGTSRIQEGMDPAVLNGTDYAPVYNASIPASQLSQNLRHLELYFRIAPGIEHVVLEGFLYSFIYGQGPEPEWDFRELATIWMSLNFSASAIHAAVRTVIANQPGRALPPYVAEGGNWVPPEHFNSNFAQDAYINTIVAAHRDVISNMVIQPTALEALEAIIALCEKHSASLTIALTPNYPWDDYRLWSLGYWPLVEEWYRTMARYPGVVSFAQYDERSIEPAGPGMTWWYDPLHFSPAYGALILKSISGQPDAPGDGFAVPVTIDTVDALLAARTRGIEDWAAANPDFVEAFELAKRSAGGPVDRQPH
jgi:hypothetical protein